MSRSRAAAFAAAACVFVVWCATAAAADVPTTLRPQVETFVAEMVDKHGMAQAELRALMRQGGIL